MADDRPPTRNQLSLHLPGPTVYLTGHSQTVVPTAHSPTTTAVLHSRLPVIWSNYDNDLLAMSVAYTASFPAVGLS
jgi:hypothetical protein